MTMRHAVTGRTTVLCTILSMAIAAAAAGAEKAGERGWIVLSDDLKAFEEPTGDWQIAGGAKLRPGNDRRLAAEPGTGVLVNGPAGKTDNLVTRQKWGDLEVELEFMIPRGSNSGVKLEGVYEIQIYDSWKVAKPKGDDCGGIYPKAELKPRYHHIDGGVPPKVNACKRPGEWQSMHIVFRAPKFDGEGKKIANAKFEKVELNGKLIHENVEVPTPTGHIWRQKETATGPLFLQADHGPVAFRNIRVRPL